MFLYILVPSINQPPTINPPGDPGDDDNELLLEPLDDPREFLSRARNNTTVIAEASQERAWGKVISFLGEQTEKGIYQNYRSSYEYLIFQVEMRPEEPVVQFIGHSRLAKRPTAEDVFVPYERAE